MTKTKYQIKVTLCDTHPPVWRRIVVGSSLELPDLHDVLQISMGWQDYHLHQFSVGQKRYGVLDPDWDDDEIIDEQEVPLSSIFKGNTKTIIYEYDFGDSWVHEIILEKVLPMALGDSLAVCIEGERACPPEDCGGTSGFQSCLEAIADPSHEDYEDMINWVGSPFNPVSFSVDQINKRLKRKETALA